MYQSKVIDIKNEAPDALKYQLGAKSFKILDNYAEVTSKRKVLIMKAHRRYQSYMRRRGMI